MNKGKKASKEEENNACMYADRQTRRKEEKE